MAAPSSYSSTAPGTAATGAGRRVFVSIFKSLTDTVPSLQAYTRHDLTVLLTNHLERPTKGGTGFGPAIYRRGATRGVDGVTVVTALTYEVDHAEPPWALLDPYDYVAYTTHSHTPADPHWRLVLFLTTPIPKTEYGEVWRRGQHWLVPNADEACKDPSRFFYLPTCPPGSPPETRVHAGAPLDWRQLAAVPEDPAPERPQRERAATSGRPGDDFNARADWHEVLEPRGWRYVCARPDGVEYWRKPGKTEGWQATVNYAGSDMLYMWSSTAPPFQAKTAYDKFGAYARLEHRGDLTAATKRLAAEGYGTPASTLDVSGNGHGHQADVPPPNGRERGDDEDAPETFATTDLGNAERFVAQHGPDVRYCAPWTSWLLWGGSHWERDTSLGIHLRAKQTVRRIYHEAAEADTKEARRELAAWARRSEAEARINAMLSLARPHVGIQPQDLNSDPWLLNVLNGVLDLRTGRLVPHDRHDLITKVVPVRYDPTATCPTFAAFLQTILAERQELITFLQRAIGYSLTGDTREQVLFILHGLGSNGKSTLLDVCHALLGDYAKNTPFETFLHRDRDVIRNDLAALFSGRLVSASEIEPGQRLSEGLVKSLTGSDPITARFLFQESFTFAPTFKLWLSCNHKPTIRGTDHAIWRRIRLVPFTVQIPDDQQDKQLLTKLRAELPGILNWAMAGCLAWQEHGLGLPDAVKAATQAYRDEMDTVGDFLAEQCVEDPQAYVAAAALYTAYLAWCETAGEKPISQKALGQRLRERSCTDGRVGKPQKRVWHGLRLVGDLDT